MNSDYTPLENLSVRKSNELVSAKYKSTLLENQIMAIALTRIEAEAIDGRSQLVARLYPGELKRLVGDPTHIYRTLKSVSSTIIGHGMILEDGKGNFNAFSIVNNADYVDGVFTVEFNRQLKKHILGLEKNYTTYELSVLTSFKRSSSFRLYELLKREIYKSKPTVNGGRVDVEYRLSEFRFMVGLANSDDPTVKNAIGRQGKNIDWDAMYEKLNKKDRKYDTWGELRRNVIIPAQTELEERSNIRFDYDGLREGRKIAKVIFHIYPNVPADMSAIDERCEILRKGGKDQFRQLEMPRDQFPEIYAKYENHNGLEKEDIDLLLYKAKYDTKKVERAIAEADAQNQIDNYMGWLIGYLKAPKEYEKVPVINGSAAEAERAINILKEYESTKAETAERVWNKAKMKEEFGDFLVDLEKEGVTLEQLEDLFEAPERTDIFFQWKKKGVIVI